MRMAANTHALPVYKKYRITSLLGIFETSIYTSTMISSNDPRFIQCIYRLGHASKRFVEV